jgi:hypothetical protein
MLSESKKKEIRVLLKVSPVLIIGEDVESFKNATILEPTIENKDLHVYEDPKGLIVPSWLKAIEKGKASKLIIIKNIDEVPEVEQNKFYEMLKYKSIGSYAMPESVKIIVIAKQDKNVSELIRRLCLVV